ncbi:DNA primase [Candidatus Saccharibacteria bacterium]|nr:DNA primase [Candidatus Saccharibacteria bacterium]
MEDVKEEIRARLPVEDVVGQYIELKRAGRSMKGRSPWGVDKTPSFMVSPEKGIWHDFSANKGGDIFSFVMEVEGISFREALEKLAAQAGVELSKYSMGDKKVAQRKVRIREATEWACKYYQVCLAKNREVCEYVFYKRNMNRETVKTFRIGYSPRVGKALVQFLTKKGYTTEEMREAGLLNQYGGDLFRGRMMVPFIDSSGVIGFTARVLDGGEPKYLNTPETLLFNKGRFIFGLAQAKEAIRKNGFCVIVEGNMDVISSHQAGVREAVATSGTAMTEMHLKQLSRMTDDIRLAYDGDAAGVRATERSVMLAGKLGIGLSVISGYGGAKDPDELIQKDPKLWQAAVEERVPAVEWLLNKYEEELDLLTGPGKKGYSDVAMRVISFLQDPVERKHYQQMVARKLDVSVEDLVAKKIDGENLRLKKVKTEGGVGSRKKMIEDNLLAIVIYGGGVDIGVEMEIPSDEGRLAELEMIFENRYGGWEMNKLEAEARELWSQLKTEEVEGEIAKLERELEEVGDDEERMKEVMRKIMALRRGR